MTDKQIIQALNTATNVDGLQICCIDYENNPKNVIYLSIKSDILDLINRQQAEIERLKNCVKSEDEVMDIAKRTMEPLVKEITREQIDIAVKLAKTEAIKEFAERLKDDSWFTDLFDRNDYPVRAVTKEDIDNLVKEMVGDDK